MMVATNNHRTAEQANAGTRSRSAARPLSFIYPVREENDIAWRIAVRFGEGKQVAASAATGPVLTSHHVRDWFRKYAKRWPKLLPDSAVDEFVQALNVLRVTRSATVRELQNESASRQANAKDMAQLKAVIDFASTKLPVMLSAWEGNAPCLYSHDQMERLWAVAAVGRNAQGIVAAPKPMHREVAWHPRAHLIAWHLRRLLREAGCSVLGDDWNGPLVRVTRVALGSVEKSEPELGAIAKALQRATTPHAMSPGWTEGKGYVVVA